MKTYGNEKTSLTLTEMADRVYSNSDFCIVEADEGTYAIYIGRPSAFNLVREGMTCDEVNEELEAYAEED